MIDIDGRIYMTGIYEAKVVDDNDPTYKNRVRVRVYALHEDNLPVDQLPWARPCINKYGNDSGDKHVPNLNEHIWVTFDQGNPENPVWMGGFLEEGDTRSGDRVERIDGSDELLVMRDQDIEVRGNQDITVHGSKSEEVVGKCVGQFDELETVVVGTVEYTFGRKIETVEGKEEKYVDGNQLLVLAGSRELTVADQLKTSVGGTEHKTILKNFKVLAVNFDGLPTSNAVGFECTNGLFEIKSTIPNPVHPVDKLATANINQALAFFLYNLSTVATAPPLSLLKVFTDSTLTAMGYLPPPGPPVSPPIPGIPATNPGLLVTEILRSA